MYYFWAAVDFTLRHGFWLWGGAVTAIMIAGGYACWDELVTESKTHGITSLVRDIALVWGGLIGLGLATWRSIVAERQARTADEAKLNARLHQAMESLESENADVRIGAIHALRQLAWMRPLDYGEQVTTTLRAREHDLKNKLSKKNAIDSSPERKEEMELELGVIRMAVLDISTVGIVVGLSETPYERALGTVRRKRTRKSREVATESKAAHGAKDDRSDAQASATSRGPQSSR